MKKWMFLMALAVLVPSISYAQVPKKFNYQAVVRNNTGELISDQTIRVRASIIGSSPTGATLYSEIHEKTTDSYGMVSLMIGKGTIELGSFDNIHWNQEDKYLNIEIDAGNGYADMGTVQLISVPYALHASSAEVLGSKGVYTTASDTLFVVKDHQGNVVFAVFPDGAQVYVNETAKGKVGGFAVSGRNPSKATEMDIFRVTQDSTRIFVNDTVNAKGKVGGFAVSGRNPSKTSGTEILFVTSDSTRVYVNEKVGTKGKVGGFAVSGRNPSKAGALTSYMQVTPDSTRIFVKDSTAGFGIVNIEGGTSESLLNLTKQNYLIGHNAGANITSGKYNSMIGYESGYSAETSYSNLFFGHQSGYSNIFGHDNIFIGNKTGFDMTSGYDNIFIGNLAGENSGGATHSTFIGNEAGKNVNGDDNICIGDRTGYNQYVTDHEFFSSTIVGIDAGRNFTGSSNVSIGTGAGSSWGGAASGSNNVFVGAGAGAGGYTSKLGNNNVCIGYDAGFGATGNSQLFIANNSTTTLIYGDFVAEEVLINGDLTATSVTPSDINLKTNIQPIQSGLNLLLSLGGYYFNWNDKAQDLFHFSQDEQQIGIIAQEVEKVIPQMVKTNSKGYKVVEYSKFSPIVIEAIKEQQNYIESLEAKNKELEDRIKRLEELILK